jgi:carboxypeptidase T
MSGIIVRRSTTSFRAVLIILICQVLLVSFIPLYSFQSQTQGPWEEPSLYHTYEEMVSKIEDLKLHNSSIVVVQNLTTTYEGRTMFAIKISDTPTVNDSQEQDILFMAGLEANSLISVEIAMFLVEYLTFNYGVNSRVTDLVNTREIWIIPMANPDGHEFIGDETLNWEKNRKENGDGTFGVNLNRNFEFQWGEDEHSSNNSDSPNYIGPTPFSEPETQAIRSLVRSQDFVFSLSFSSSGEVITFPWGYTNDTISGFKLLSEIANDMAMYNNYNVKQASQHQANRGNIDDWLYGEGILPFTILVGSEDLPLESEIEVIAQENLEACFYLLDIADDPNRALTAQWTYMAYMGGDDDLLEKWGIADINEMEVHGSSPYVNILAQFDRYSGAAVTNPDWTDTRRFHVTKDYDIEIINTPPRAILGETNSGDPQTLLDFVNWSITNYPAEHYFLDIWGHGKGWQGVSGDATGDWLEMDEIKSVLGKFKDRIDVVGFDNCNMAMIEVYTTFLGYTDYIVGSEKEIDAVGWPYDIIFGDLQADPFTTPLDLARNIAIQYVDWAENSSYYSATVSVTDMAYLQDMINRTDELAKVLDRMLTIFYDDIEYSVLHTEKYKQSPSPRDLYHFMQQLIWNVNSTPVKLAAENVMDGFENLIPANEFWTSPHEKPPVPVDNAHGITVWLYDGSPPMYSEYILLDYALMTHWDEFLVKYKNGITRPQVEFDVGYTLSNSDSQGYDDTITLDYSTDISGLNVTVEIFTSENVKVMDLYTNGTQTGMQYTNTFNPGHYGLPSDYYNFFLYLEDSTGTLQNYSEAVSIWLGNQRPDIVLANMTLYRDDGNQVGGFTGKNPIEDEYTTISVIVKNNGSNALTSIILDIFEDGDSIYTETLTLQVGEEKNITFSRQFSSGLNSLRAIVDPDNDIKEINESNNARMEILDVKSQIPQESLIIRGRIFNRDDINIIGAKVRITNLRTNRSLNRTTTEKGYKAELDSQWYREGDMIEVKASYNSVTGNSSVFAYSDDKEVYANITLKTELYDALFYFKLGLIIFEIIGFVLVIKYYISLKRFKPKE